jgi:hypothetical protein
MIKNATNLVETEQENHYRRAAPSSCPRGKVNRDMASGG